LLSFEARKTFNQLWLELYSQLDFELIMQHKLKSKPFGEEAAGKIFRFIAMPTAIYEFVKMVNIRISKTEQFGDLLRIKVLSI